MKRFNKQSLMRIVLSFSFGIMIMAFQNCSKTEGTGILAANSEVESGDSIETLQDTEVQVFIDVQIGNQLAESQPGVQPGVPSIALPTRAPSETFIAASTGACRHVKSDDYDNRSKDRDYRMECSREVNLIELIAAPAGKKIKGLKVFFQTGNAKRHSYDDRDKIFTYPTNTVCKEEYSDAFEVDVTQNFFWAQTNCAPGETNNILERPAVCHNNKWFGSSLEFDAATQALKVSNAGNGWGECRETGCSACVGNVRVEYQLESI